MSKVDFSDRRKFPRLELTNKVKLIGGDTYMVAESLNISYGGMKLNKRIPSHLMDSHLLWLFHENKEAPPFPLQFKILQNDEDSIRLEFVLASQSMSRFETWIRFHEARKAQTLVDSTEELIKKAA